MTDVTTENNKAGFNFFVNKVYASHTPMIYRIMEMNSISFPLVTVGIVDFLKIWVRAVLLNRALRRTFYDIVEASEVLFCCSCKSFQYLSTYAAARTVQFSHCGINKPLFYRLMPQMLKDNGNIEKKKKIPNL